MSEIHDLLLRAGHKPAKHSKAWVCADCPKGKAPAMKVTADLFYCHRCQRGGNVVMLKRQLGLLEPKTAAQLKREREIRQAAEIKLARIKDWQQRWRRSLILKFRAAYDLELALRQRGAGLIECGLPVDADTLSDIVMAANDKDFYEARVKNFDNLSMQELIKEYECFQNSCSKNTMTAN